MNPFTESQPSTRRSATPHDPSPASDQVVPGLDSGFSDADFSPPRPSPPLRRHGSNYSGPQASPPYSTHPPHMVYSSSPPVFHHPGMPAREASLSNMYAPPSMMSMPRPHAPVYSYQGTSSDPTSSPHQMYGAGTAAPTFPVYPPHPNNLSHSVSQWRVSTTSTGEAQHPTSYSIPGTYPPLGYTTQPPYIHPPTSFVPAPSIYGSHYPPLPHSQPYGSPTEQEHQGGWLDYPSTFPQNEASTPRSPSLTRRSIVRSRLEGPSGTRTESTPSYLPALSTSSQTRTTKTPPSSESWGDWNEERRSYHPKSPAHRSDWVMWVGNVPSDMTPDNLRAFFNRSLPPRSSNQSRHSPDLRQVCGGVSSVFLIPRSNCAFVNFESESQLEAAIARFHDKPIRFGLPRLVCRVRKRTDDLKAGVGAQRDGSMHIKWIKEQREIAKREGAELVGLVKAGGLSTPSSTSDDEGRGKSSAPSSSGSDSLTSTNSGILARYFPQRYFILKSLTQDDLDLSVQNKYWATQQHNEEILDQAYRTSKDVFFIFGANKSGEFYGYARMAGPILHSDDPISWASLPASFVPPRSSAVSDVEGNVPISSPAGIGIVEEFPDPHYVFPPGEHRVVEQSPKVIFQTQEEAPDAKVQAYSVPAELHDPHELSADAPYFAATDQSVHRAVIPASSSESEDILEHARDAGSQVDDEEPTKDPKVDLEKMWGRRPFRVDWIRTKHLSFLYTKHIRNPWNCGREVKISRDGTELEPTVGRQLLEEWDKRSPSPADILVESPRTALRRKSL